MNSFIKPPIPRRIPLAGYNSRRLNQIEIRPEIKPHLEVKAPISIELGSLPLSIGLFGGSALSFLVRSGLPKGLPQTAAMVVGSGLALAGIVNLIVPELLGKKEAAAVSTPSPTAPSAPRGAAAPAGESYVPPTAPALSRVTGRISHPAEFATVDIWPWSSSYPVRVQLENTSNQTVTFELELHAEEEPHPVGDAVTSSIPVQVTLGPGQVSSVDVEMPVSSWNTAVDYIDVVLHARKRRVPGETPQLIDVRSFVIE